MSINTHMGQTSDKRPIKTGKGGTPVPVGKKFSKENQPPPENKSKGKLAKKRGYELAQAILKLAFKGTVDGKIKAAAAAYYGVPEDEITVEMMLLFRQAEKAIGKADTAAFNAVMDRTYGKAKQAITGLDDAPLIPNDEMDLSMLTDDELRVRAAIDRKIAAAKAAKATKGK